MESLLALCVNTNDCCNRVVHVCARTVGKHRISAKINKDNEGSIQLFKKLGYQFVKEVVAFGQIEFEKLLE